MRVITTLKSGHVLACGIGQIAYLKTDEAQLERIVTEIKIMPGTTVMYLLSCEDKSGWFYDCEIAFEKNNLKRLL